MAFSDARNERDRAETGRNSTNHGGGDAKAAERRNVNAMAATNRPMNKPFAGMPAYQPRRAVNPTPSYEMSLHNMYELSKMLPGPGLMARAGMAIAGYGPDFQGYTGQRFGIGDYDPSNRSGMGQPVRPPVGVQPVAGVGQPGQPAQPMPGLMQSQVPAATLGGPIPGLQNYSVNLPSYGYFGQPGQQRPRSAMLRGF